MAKSTKKAAKKAAKTSAASSGIIDPKYREAMANRDPDWVSQHIAKHASDGEDGVTSKRVIELAKANQLNQESLDQLRKTDANAGRVRMTIGNMLRAAARQRHGLFGTDGKFYKADPAFLKSGKFPAPSEPTHDREGTKFAKAKAAPAKAASKKAGKQQSEAAAA